MPEIVELGIRFDESDVSTVDRVDFLGRKIGNIKKTDDGYLQGEAPIAKMGILTYALADGTFRKELVIASTLFNQDSMDSLKMKPVTNQHPPEVLLDSGTVKRRKVGFTGENVRRDDNFLVTSLAITDADAIGSIDNGTQELSPGYKCEIIKKDGIFESKKYDAIQIKRTYNHVAICDKARGGSDLKLNLDSESVNRVDGFEIVSDAVLTAARRKALPDSAFCFVRGKGEDKIRKFPTNDAIHVRNGLSRLPQSNLSPSDKASVLSCLKKKAKQFGVKVSEDSEDVNNDFEQYNFNEDELNIIKRKGQSMPRINIDGIDYDVEAKEVVNFCNKLVKKNTDSETTITDLTKTKDDLQGKLDTVNDEIKTLKEVNIDEKVKKGVKARIDLETKAARVLDKKAMEKIDTMTDLEVKKAVIVKKSPDAKATQAKLDDKEVTDVYIQARFDSVIELLPPEKKGDKAINRQRATSAPRADSSDDEDIVKKSRNDMIDRMTHAHEDEKEKKD